MSREPHQPIIFTRTRSAWYVAVLVALAIGGYFCVRMNQQWHAQYNQWAAQQRQREAAHKRHVRAQMDAQIRVSNLRVGAKPFNGKATRTDAERLLNDGKPFADPSDSFRYSDPVTGGTVWLFFEGDAWISVHYDEPNPYPNSSPGLHRGYRTVDPLRLTAYGLTYAAAGSMLLWLMYNWRRMLRIARMRAAMDLLFLFALTLALVLLGPKYLAGLTTFWIIDAGGWAVIGIAVAASLLVFAARTRECSHRPRCASCGYDLTGNISGVCPECGHPVAISPALRSRGHSQPVDSAL